MRVPLIRSQYFYWVIVPPLIWLAAELVGPPSMVWSYTYTAKPGREYNPRYFAERRYQSCTYISLLGEISTHPAREEKCPFVRMFVMEDRLRALGLSRG